MNRFQSTAFAALFALATPFSVLASGEHKGDHQKEVKAASIGAMTEGEVKKIDKVTRKITIKHGEIKNLDMPAMTMVFLASDVALLEKVKPGDKIKFVAEKSKAGYGVIAIEVLK